IVRYETASDEDERFALAELEAAERLPTVPSGRARATTDRGTPIILKERPPGRGGVGLSEVEEHFLHNTQLDSQVIRRGSADDSSNCHGWVFAGGRFHISGEAV